MGGQGGIIKTGESFLSTHKVATHPSPQTRPIIPPWLYAYLYITSY